MKFSEVVGQSITKQKVLPLLRSGRLPHALMLLGPEGNGNLALAIAMATYLQCENPSEEDACGECSSCQKNQKFIHPDVRFSFPVVKPEKKKSPPVSKDYILDWRSALAENVYLSYNDWMQSIGAENRQGNITAEECREIIHQLNLKTYESGYKIQIIWLVELLGQEGNILLKSLEEPPPNTIFILIAENGEAILNTILSRVQLIKMSGIEDEDIAQALLQRFDTDEETALRIARISDGNFNAALTYAQGENKPYDQVLRQWLLACYNLKLKPSGQNTETLLGWIEEMGKSGRENQKIFLKYALFFIRECTYLALTGGSQKLYGDELKFAGGLAKQLGVEQIETMAKLVNALHYHIERNGNPKILWMSTSFKIASVFMRQEVEVD